MKGCVYQLTWIKALWGIFFNSDWYRKAQPTVGGATSGQVVLDCLRKLSQPYKAREHYPGPLL